MAVLIDSYSTTNKDYEKTLANSSYNDTVGQAITISGKYYVSSVKFYLKRVGTATGNMFAKIYAATGSVGTTAKPTGSALVTSSALDVSTIPTDITLIEFNFVPYLVNNQSICILCSWSNGSVPTNYIGIGQDSSSPSHAGNAFYSQTEGTWTAESGYDTIFELYGGIPVATQAFIL